MSAPWALTFAPVGFCSPRHFWVTFHCALSGRGLVFQATDSSLQFSSAELLWSLKRVEWGGGGWGIYIGKTWALELDHGLTEVFPCQYPCSSNNCYMGVAMPNLSAAHLPPRNHSAPPCGSGRDCQSWHSFPWKRVSWSKMANHRAPTSQWHNSRKGHVTQTGPLRFFSGILLWGERCSCSPRFIWPGGSKLCHVDRACKTEASEANDWVKIESWWYRTFSSWIQPCLNLVTPLSSAILGALFSLDCFSLGFCNLKLNES